jgi:NADPH2:quinone reductase
VKAAYLVEHGKAERAFELREVDKPQFAENQVLIKVEAFGLNFADVMARLGHYRDSPPLPALLGYDVVGRVESAGYAIKHLKTGDRVTALTRFGGYAEYAVSDGEVTHKIPEQMPPGVAVALATQYCTAYYMAHDLASFQEGDKVLIHAAAGGVGTALVQMALNSGCTIYGTCSSPKKIAYLKKQGVQYPIDYTTSDFAEEIERLEGKCMLDTVFDPIGGISARKGFRLLQAGGKLICYGVSSMNRTSTIFGKLKVLYDFGLYHPVKLLLGSKGIIGVNMLKLADENPLKISRSMRRVIQLNVEQKLQPVVGRTFGIEELGQAHAFLESRQSIGKIVVMWRNDKEDK